MSDTKLVFKEDFPPTPPPFCQVQRSRSDLIYFDNKRTFGTKFNEAVLYFSVVAPAGSGIKYVRNVTFRA